MRFLSVAVTFLLMTVISTKVWEATVARYLYDCTDDLGCGYLTPGEWIHRPVKAVAAVVHGRSMSQPDTIRAGMSGADLWCIWWSFFLVSAGVSLWPVWSRVTKFLVSRLHLESHLSAAVLLPSQSRRQGRLS